MKKINIALIGLVMSASTALAATPYIEGQVIFTEVDDVDTNTYTDTVAGSAVVGKLTNKYDTDTGYGFEVGAIGLFDNQNLRLGISYGKTKIKLKSTTASGTIGGDAGSLSITPAEWAAVGVNFDNDIKAYSLNGYYDFAKTDKLTPFIGLGVGQVDIQNAKDKEFSTSLYLGARYSVNDNVYLGGKVNYTMINGPEDKLGIQYDDITQYGLTLSVGYLF
jgi:opacity protein-like surface antigen